MSCCKSEKLFNKHAWRHLNQVKCWNLHSSKILCQCCPFNRKWISVIRLLDYLNLPWTKTYRFISGFLFVHTFCEETGTTAWSKYFSFSTLEYILLLASLNSFIKGNVKFVSWIQIHDKRGEKNVSSSEVPKRMADIANVGTR